MVNDVIFVPRCRFRPVKGILFIYLLRQVRYLGLFLALYVVVAS
jgi:hypothetical protein